MSFFLISLVSLSSLQRDGQKHVCKLKNLIVLSAESPIKHPGNNGVAVLNVTDSKKLLDTGLETGKQLIV